jgi:GDPmannose 4,6-dehydratase
MKSAIIFGASGQDGYLLNNILINNKVITHLVSRNNSPIKGDISNYDFVSKLIKSVKPDYIFHFAATSNVSHEFLFENHSSISLGTINILESVKTYSKESKVFIAGSAEQFENNGEPINESSPFKANSSYSAERIYSTHISRYFRGKYNVQVYLGFFFHHDSPFRSNNHLNQRIINFVKDLSLESNSKFRIGDYTIQKEFNYSEDFMEAVWLLINQNDIYEVVIGSGKPYPISDWLELAFAKRNLDWKEWIELDKEYNKPYDKLYSDPSLMKSLGWNPKLDKIDLLNLMY